MKGWKNIMRNETAAEKEKRVFEFYKKDLERMGEEMGHVRMIVIEYVCSFPKINPYKMPAIIVLAFGAGVPPNKNRSRPER